MVDPTPQSLSLSEEVRKLLSNGANSADNLRETLLTVTAVNITPVIPGGPFTNTIKEINGEPHWEGIRPTAVRGVWRWWVRTLLASILWEKEIRNYDYQTLAKIEAKELGLGSINVGGGVKGEASKLVLEVKVNNNLHPPLTKGYFELRGVKRYLGRKKSGKFGINFDNLTMGLLRNLVGRNINYYYNDPSMVLLSIPRYTLLVMDEIGRDPYRGVPHKLYLKQPMPPNGIEVKLTLKSRGKVSEIAAVMGTVALLLSITLGGLGQASSRGFGKMRIESIDGGSMSALAEDVINNLSNLARGQGNAQSFLRNLIEIIKEAEGLRDVIRAAQANSRSPSPLPRTPTFHTDTLKFRIISNPKCRVRNSAFPVRDSWTALIAIGRACLKSEWKAIKGLGWRASGRRLHTWPLGLPRNIKGKGYVLGNNEAGRLTSLIRFTPFELSGRGRLVVLAYAFKTSDLEVLRKSLYHVGTRNLLVSRIGIRGNQRVTGDDYLIEAFNTATQILS